MMPMYRCMDSHPMNGNQMPSNHNYHPSFEAMAQFGNFDPSKSVVINQPWPYANNMVPVPCYPWYSHGNFPGCYSNRPCPHFSSQPFHCCGYHPPFPDSFPVHYVPPNYVRELPRYEFDKLRDNYHCCGCPNHTHDQRKGESVKVEEQEPEGENKVGNSLVPFQLKNYPYPVLWIPPEYVKNKEQRKPLESDLAGREISSQDMKPAENVKPSQQDPRVWSGWFPVDMKSLQPLMQANDGRSTQDQNNEDKMRHFPFPIIWTSPYNKQGEAGKEERGEMNAAPKTVEDLSVSKPYMIHESSGDQLNSEPKEKISKKRSIPVKQMEATVEKDKSEDAERAQTDFSLRKMEDNGMVKASGASAKRQSLSPPKASKLPPVCLRVDPLPRKKNGNTNSRSPSPPGLKRQSQKTAEDTPNVFDSSDLTAKNDQIVQVQDCTSISSKEPETKKNVGKDVEGVKRNTIVKTDEEQRSSYQSQFPISSSVDFGKEASNSLTLDKIKKNEEEDIKDNNSHANELKADQVKERKETINASRSCVRDPRAEEKKLSAEEAALRIQSAYRGFEVRKWEPLKKLRQIAKVKEEVVEVRNKICGLESLADLQRDEKQRAVIGEMIMNLLLRLDTIQGLHPSLRDVRKSLARELVMLQEKLDLFAKATSSKNPLDPNDIIDDKGRNVEVNQHDAFQQKGVVADTQGEETLKHPIVVEEEHRKFEQSALPVTGNLESCFKGPEDNVGGGELHSSEELITENDVPSDFVQTFQMPLEKSVPEEVAGAQLENVRCDPNGEVQFVPVEINESMHMDDNLRMPEELPEGVTQKEPADSGEEQQIATNMVGVEQEKSAESSLPNGSAFPAAVVDESTVAKEILESNFLRELPVGVIDDAQPGEKHAQTEIQDNEVLPGRDLERKPSNDASEQQLMESCKEQEVTIDDSSPNEGVPALNELQQRAAEVLDEERTITEATLPDKEVPIQWESNQQPMEGFNKEVSITESNDDSIGKEISGGDALETPILEVVDSKRVEESQPEEARQASLLLWEESQDEVQKEVDQEIVDINSGSISEAKTTVNISQVEEVQIGENQDNVDQPTAGDGNKDITQEDNESHELEMMSGSDGVANQSKGMETTERETVVPSGGSQPSIKEQEIEMESNRKLIEENEKMRLMMEKLVESGKQQLAVISNLSGRVKDLEKKLSRKKKMRTRRCRTAISTPSSATMSSKPSPRKRSVGVAI
ncbi:hypothetical protein JCGZ_14311 [Jatropha curcas]|uniref:BAG domain-containing protein n=1 Tax=Jatropha curcas TaxID=180498 RepID=A0A067K8D2_JATCU|nr:BAG family molecular chaperone regulator 6 [Jatropha curcas]KDP28540.1 hypothetical protein JCGZ_14311 [Jatropha curcas]